MDLKIDPATLWCGFVDVTPELAEEWSNYNVHNRTKSEGRKIALANAIQEGDWLLNGETIKLGVDADGRPWLIDGQHRVESIIEAGQPVESVVVTGLNEPGVQETVDTGRKRTVGDMLKLRGEKDYHNLAAAIRHAYRYIHYYDLRQQLAPETAQQLIAMLDEHGGIRDSVRVSRNYTILGMPKSLVAALHYLFGMVHVGDRDDFFEKLHTGYNLPENDAIGKLRNWLIRREADAHKVLTPHVAAITIKAWNAWREGRPVRGSLSWKAGGRGAEGYPVIHGMADALERGAPEDADDESVVAA